MHSKSCFAYSRRLIFIFNEQLRNARGSLFQCSYITGDVTEVTQALAESGEGGLICFAANQPASGNISNELYNVGLESSCAFFARVRS